MQGNMKYLLIAALFLSSCNNAKFYSPQEVRDSYHVVTYIDREHDNICYIYVPDVVLVSNPTMSISCLPLKD